MELFFMLKKCSFKFLPPRNWNQSVLHVVTLEQGLEGDCVQSLSYEDVCNLP